MTFHRKYIKLITKVMQSGQVVGEELRWWILNFVIIRQCASDSLNLCKQKQRKTVA